MEKNIIYHGSNVVVPTPKILINGHYKDFGYGFYCTNMEKQAKRWALTRRGASIVNKYNYMENKELNICTFSEMTEDWLQFIVDCRRGKEHKYDIVEGPMADELVKFKYPTHQIVFCTENALKTLVFEGSDTL